jgi:sterol desaturase/sphingolipid hydroxylase (fatty acid hydroxylase superfamily)
LLDGPAGISEGALRLGMFAAVFLLLAAIEFLRPRRTLTARKVRRWTTNLSIISIDALVVRGMAMLTVPLAGTAAALYADANGLGLLHAVAWPSWLETAIAVVVLDLAIWAQHVATHKVPVLWRLHQVHHADRDIDVTTGLRFHPLEIGLSILWKIVCVLALGASLWAVVLFEIILNAGAMFSHANIRLPLWLDRGLRLVIVTPDMHRVHHSVIRQEHDSNFGFNLSVWDRLFRTYRAQPDKGHDDMTIGLSPYQSDEPTKLGWSLVLPLRPWSKWGPKNSENQ